MAARFLEATLCWRRMQSFMVNDATLTTTIFCGGMYHWFSNSAAQVVLLVLLFWNKMILAVAACLGRKLPTERTRTWTRWGSNKALRFIRVLKVFWILCDAPWGLAKTTCCNSTVSAFWREYYIVALTEEKHVNNAVLKILLNGVKPKSKSRNNPVIESLNMA